MRGTAYTATVAALLAIVGTSTAQAGIYNVVACADSTTSVNNSWVVSNTTPSRLEIGNGCGGSGDDAGLYARDVLDVANSPSTATAQWTFTAPTSTSIVALSYSRWFFKEDDDDWRPAVTADGSGVDTCTIVYPSIDCNSGVPGGQRTSRTFAGATSLSIGVSCAAPAMITCGNGALDHHKVNAVLYGATVTLTDSSSPTISNVNGSLLAGGYLTGSKAAAFDASDNVGIRQGHLYVDGAVRTSTTYACDFTYAVPCTNKTGASLSIDTRQLDDGSHDVQVATVDPAGNEVKSATRTVTVDNSAPDGPAVLTVDGGGDWRASNSFSASWANPAAQTAPIAAAHYEVCALDGSGCQAEQVVPGADITRLDGLSVPTTGEWDLRVWLEDAAGNVDATQVAHTTLRYGNPPPTTPATNPAPDTTTLLTPASPDDTALIALPGVAAPIRRLDPRLRLTSAKLRRGRLYIRGRFAGAETAKLTITIRAPGRRSLRRIFPVHTGRFTLRLKAPAIRGTVVARVAGTTAFLPARSSVRITCTGDLDRPPNPG